MEEAKRPQKNSFELIVRLKTLNSILMYAIFIASVISPFLTEKHLFYGIQVKVILGTLNFVGMILFAGFTFIVDYVLFPNSEKIRRADFIDNSLGSRLNISQSENYFSNDEKSQGVYKAAVNLFENSLFTLRISKKMQFGIIVKSLMFIIIVIILAVQGFKDSNYAIPFLRLFLSANILGELVKLLLFVSRNETYFNDLVTLFNNKDFKTDTLKYLPQFLKTYSDYETNLAWGTILLDSKIYNKLNAPLSEEWEKIKKQFDI